MSIQILLADDHGVLRTGLRFFLESQSDFKVVGEANNGHEAVRKTRSLRPNLVLLDIAMPELNGVEAARQICAEAPETRVIMLSMHDTPENIYQALQAGARGYVLKESASEELLEAIRAVCAGRRHLSAKIADGLIDDYLIQRTSVKKENPLELLSPREREILQLVAEGKSSSAIGSLIMLSPKTVETYRSRLMQKLGLNDVPSLVKFALRFGVISI